MLKAVIWLLSNAKEVREVTKEEKNSEHLHINQHRGGGGEKPPKTTLAGLVATVWSQKRNIRQQQDLFAGE